MASELFELALGSSPYPSSAILYNNQQTTHPQVFHHFPDLPQELRNLVWGLAYSPQKIHIYQENLEYLVDSPRRYVEYSDVPSALHVCKESRYLALKFYQLVDNKNHVFQHRPRNQKFYFNFTHNDFCIYAENLCFSKMFDLIKYFNHQF